MREIRDHGELAALCGGDTLCLWAAQGLDGGSRAWASAGGRAVAIAGPDLSGRDRLAVRGPASAAVPLVRAALAEAGDGGRVIAVGALARSAPAVGLLTGVAVHPRARGRGAGRRVCAFLITAALARHGAVALMVDETNHAARRLYASLGLRSRRAAVSAGPNSGPGTGTHGARSPGAPAGIESEGVTQ